MVGDALGLQSESCDERPYSEDDCEPAVGGYAEAFEQSAYCDEPEHNGRPPEPFGQRRTVSSEDNSYHGAPSNVEMKLSNPRVPDS